MIGAVSQMLNKTTTVKIAVILGLDTCRCERNQSFLIGQRHRALHDAQSKSRKILKRVKEIIYWHGTQDQRQG